MSGKWKTAGACIVVHHLVRPWFSSEEIVNAPRATLPAGTTQVYQIHKFPWEETKNHFPHQFKSGKNFFDQQPVLNTLSCQIPSINSPIITGFLCHVEEILANERCLNYLWSLNKPGSSLTSKCAKQTFLSYQGSTTPFTGLTNPT